MNYLDGSEVLAGDVVLIEHGKTPGTIVAVVERDRLPEFGVDEPGVMISAAPFGLLYIPLPMFESQGLSFTTRGQKSNLRWSGHAE